MESETPSAPRSHLERVFRIASLVPSLTELLFALGLGPHVVARTGFCIHPREARAVPKVGGTKDPDLALLRAIAPTHLVVNVDENRREDVEAAREFVPNILVTHPLAPVDNLALFATFGDAFDCRARADALIAQLEASLSSVRDAMRGVPRERALYLIWRKPWMTVSRQTYVSASLALVGWDTVPEQSESRYPRVADDDPAWKDAQRILLSSEPYAFRERDVREMKERHGKPAALVDGEWTSWYGVRAIEGLAALARFRLKEAL
jgi:ABC-type Fe3+-hydroxamate transport system substrate-binding protein